MATPSTSDLAARILEEIAEIKDPTERTRRAGELMEQLGQVVDQTSTLRHSGLMEMLDSGMNRSDIARALDLTRTRVSQLLAASAPQERAFLGTRLITVAIGGKHEHGRPDHTSQPVVSAEAMAAYQLLADLTRSVGLDAESEVVPPPGIVNLARPNLVVLTSPRLMPVVSQVLGADPAYTFDYDAEGWYLIEKASGEVHRPPRDTTGDPVDYAYLGRLPRPDSQGTFVYLAGVHAMGTLGAVTYLADNLGALWRDHRTRRFSMLLSCRYDRKKRTIVSVEPLAPAQRHEGA